MRVRRIALFVALFSLVPVAISILGVAMQQSNTAFSVRLVEWLRDNGARGIVNQVENIYYTWNAPATGGAPLRHLSGQHGNAYRTTGHRAAAHYEPPPITPLISPALPGEGIWRAPFHSGHAGPPPVLITSFRSDPHNYPQMVAGVAWIDHTLTSTMLYPGVLEPAVSMGTRGPEEIPASLRYKLVAAFNSGFKLSDSGGGFTYNGHTYAPLQRGLATLVRYTNGAVDVISWPGPGIAPRNVLYARQNLPLIVEHGVANPNINAGGPAWGATLGNAVRVWRSSVGIDRHGNLIYAAADIQTAASLAQIMIHAGAVRAMELDINAYWPSFITYAAPGAARPANLLPTMNRSPLRYLTPDDRDFFAVYLR